MRLSRLSGLALALALVSVRGFAGIPVSVWIMGENNYFPIQPVQVTNLILQVNGIYGQVAMSFDLDSVICTNVPSSLLRIDLFDTSFNSVASDIDNIDRRTDRIKIYFAYMIDGADAFNLVLNGECHGIVASIGCDALLLAHEIGHTCGLSDIYAKDNLFDHPDKQPDIVGEIRYDWLPDDWGSSSPSVHYYPPGFRQADMIHRLLMHGALPRGPRFSRGDIYGIWYSGDPRQSPWHSSMAPVGFFDHGNRYPTHK